MKTSMSEMKMINSITNRLDQIEERILGMVKKNENVSKVSKNSMIQSSNEPRNTQNRRSLNTQ